MVFGGGVSSGSGRSNRTRFGVRGVLGVRGFFKFVLIAGGAGDGGGGMLEEECEGVSSSSSDVLPAERRPWFSGLLAELSGVSMRTLWDLALAIL